MSYMKAVEFENSESKVLNVVRRERPRPKDDEVLIKVVATTVSYFDLVRRANRSLMTYLDPLLGMECSGEIVAMGSEVTGHRIGEKVCALLEGGGYGEFVAVSSWRVLPIPQGIRVDHAATLPYTSSVVWSSFFIHGEIKKNSSILIYDGVGEFGSLAIQLAKLCGCTVLACGSYTTASELRGSERLYCESIGADFFIEYDNDFVERVLENTGGRGVDFIFDPVGYSVPHSLEIVSNGGIFIFAGTYDIDKVVLDHEILIQKQINLVGHRFITLTIEDKQQILQDIVRYLWPRFERKELVPMVYKRSYDFSEVAEAHVAMLQHVNLGDKILLVPTRRNVMPCWAITMLCVLFLSFFVKAFLFRERA